MKYELLNIVKGSVPQANLAKSVPFGKSYAETTIAMADRVCHTMLGWHPERHVFNNIVSDFAPPEPEVIHGMQRVVIETADGRKIFFYVNLSLKDYGAPKVDMVLFIAGQWEFRSFVGVNAFLAVLDMLAQQLNLPENYARSFYDLVEVMEHYQGLPDEADHGPYHQLIRHALRYLIRQAVSIADFSLDASDSPRKIEAMLPWFYLLVLSYRYSPEKRAKEAVVWRHFFDEACAELSGPAAKEFEWKWNVFTSMPMQPGVYSAIFNLILMNQRIILGWEGCKSAKDRGTEIKVFECFNWHILFTCSRDGDNSHLQAALYHSAMHFKFCLQFFSHATGVMPCGEYSRNHPAAASSEIAVLADLDQALRILRKVDPETGKPAKPNLATYRNKIFGNQKTRYEIALGRSVGLAIGGGACAALSAATACAGAASVNAGSAAAGVSLVTTVAAAQVGAAASGAMIAAAAAGGVASLLLLPALYYYVQSRSYAPRAVQASDDVDGMPAAVQVKVRRPKARVSGVSLTRRRPATPDTKSDGRYTSLSGGAGTPGGIV